mgnify:FL=1
MDIESELQALAEARDSAMSEAATVDTESPAIEEDAVAEVDDAAADVEEVEVAEESEAEPEESATDTDETSDDSFDDLLEDIPSNEAILNTHKRIPQATKDALVEYATMARETKAQIESVGGEEGIKLLAPLSNVLTKAEVTADDALNALAPLLRTNPDAMADVFALASRVVLFTDDPNFRQFAERGDAVLQTRFGEGYDAARIEKLVALEQSGYIDSNADFESLQAEGVDSKLFQTQQETLNEQKQRIQELENLVNNPHLIEQKTTQQVNAQKDLETELTARVAQSVTPFRERGRWGEASPLTQLAMRDVLNSLKDTPDYKEAAKLVSQYGHLKSGESIPFPVEAKLSTLVRQAKGKFGELVLAINKERRVIDESSSNATIKEKVKETVPKAEEIKPTLYYNNGVPIDPDVAKLRAEFDAAVAQAGR